MLPLKQKKVLFFACRIVGLLRRFWYGQIGTLMKSFAGYNLTIPEKKEQSFLQGGTFIMKGLELQWSHYEQNPGVYCMIPHFFCLTSKIRCDLGPRKNLHLSH
ncbi:hypothetical protein DUNSADRAFT_7039 [Dunaliella salina]|uniref:Uncharacterized protein n=1 Tax=Dunaliella salina TaxID=3046 RepID=A0ABQ7FTJ5_DUNSA|nr:hypothetical protein DUNSADRAFT_7039 [Dunaliella salina]|eukprot:KAF5825772.1 hypothetical protein DUNSADRAFT_7039 [Dunaliella salina]